jgi:hypothetical protein
MNDSETRPRRSLGVVLLDGMLRLAFGTAPSPKITETAGTPRRRRAGRYLLAAGALVAVAATALLVVVLVRSPDDPTPGPGPAAALPGPQSRPPAPAATPAPTATVSRTSSPSARTAVSGSDAASATTPTAGETATRNGSSPAGGASVPLNASYATTAVGLLGYQMSVTVTNPGRATRDGWQLTVTFPRPTITVAEVTGATATQDGAVWTFTPDATTKRIGASGLVRIGFTVHGATLIDAAPQDCSIDGSPCTTT